MKPAKKSQTDSPKVMPHSPDPLKHMRDMGLAFIRLGTAMIDPDTDIMALSNAALMCGLKIKFSIDDPAKQEPAT